MAGRSPFPLASLERASPPLRILGIDPGSRVTGFGIVEVAGGCTALIQSGCIRADGEHSDRLRMIFHRLGQVVRELEPDEIAIERVFLHRNADSALKLGQARAAAICATFEADAPIYEYSARHIKKAVVGNGSAEKTQVQRMVQVILGVDVALEPDAADALAAAICHAHERAVHALLRKTAVRP